MSVTLVIIIVTCLVSIPMLNNDVAKEKVLFWPYQIKHKNEFSRFFSGALVHADLMHLAFNMLTLYSFGTAIETFLYPVFFQSHTRILYIALYVLAILFSCIPDYFKYKDQYSYRALGASGAVSAVIFRRSSWNPLCHSDSSLFLLIYRDGFLDCFSWHSLHTWQNVGMII